MPTQLAALLLATLPVLAAAGRRSAPSLSWLEQADVDPRQPDDGLPALVLGGGMAGCYSRDCGASAGGDASAAHIQDPRDLRDARAFDEDLEIDADELGDNALVAQPARPEPLPIFDKKTTHVTCFETVRKAIGTLHHAENHHCTCDDGREMMHLNSSYIPRQLPVVKCKKAPHCRALIFQVPVLRILWVGDPEYDGKAPLLEPTLQHVRWEYMQIPVACEFKKKHEMMNLTGWKEPL